MEHSIQAMPRPIRRRLKHTVQKSPDRNHVRRAMALLHLAQGHSLSETARQVCAARSTVGQWRGLYEEYGEWGLEPASRGRSPWTVTEEVMVALEKLIADSPEQFGYVRSRWSSELLALELARRSGVEVHATTVRRWLKRLGFGYRRPRPRLCIRHPKKSQANARHCLDTGR